MDSDWLKNIIIHQESSSASPPSSELITPAPPAPERRLRPPNDQEVSCPRCDSMHTKFCYYNNYSLSQPRYLCKACRRYWTKGGSLRNVPVGGGCRKNKRSAFTKIHASDHPVPSQPHAVPRFRDAATDFQLSFAQLPSPHGRNFIDCFYNYHMGIAVDNETGASAGFHGLDQLGFSVNDERNRGAIADAINGIDVKSAEKMLSLEWQEQGCAGYRMIDGHGPSAAI